MAEGSQVSETTRTTTATSSYGEPGFLARLIAIIGFIIVIIIVIWGLIHLATLISPWLSSRFASKPVAALQIHAPASATSGDAFAISWSYNTSATGIYAFLYPCSQSVTFQTPNSQGVMNSIPCGTAFSVSGTSLSLTPALSGATTSIPLTIVFTPTSGARVQASANVVINPGAAPVPVVVKKPSAQTAYAATGPADLSVTMIGATVDQNGFGTVSFDIANNGSNSSGAYSFETYLPTRAGYTYYSPIQSSLAPGSHIIDTLRFTQATPGAVSVIVDPSNMVSDTNRTNNYTGATMSAPYGYNQQTQYYNQPTYVY